jgi:hypothetical protein
MWWISTVPIRHPYFQSFDKHNSHPHPFGIIGTHYRHYSRPRRCFRMMMAPGFWIYLPILHTLHTYCLPPLAMALDLTTIHVRWGPLHTWAKSHDLVMARTLDSHPKPVPLICLKLNQFKRIIWRCLSILESVVQYVLLDFNFFKSWSPIIFVRPTSWRWA